MGRPKEFDPDAAIDAALELFWRQGYARTTPQQLADEIGIGKGSLYNAFGSKRAIFERALDRYLERRLTATALLVQADQPTRELLRAALVEVVDANFGGAVQRGCFATNSAVEVGCDDEAVARTTRTLYANTEATFRDLIERGQRNGELRGNIDARSTASMLLTAVTGMEVLSLIDEQPDRLHRVVDATVALL